MLFQVIKEKRYFSGIGKFGLEGEERHILLEILHGDLEHGDMEIVEYLHHAYDIPLSAGDFQFDPDLIDIIIFSCPMSFQQFIEGYRLDPPAIHGMDPDAIPSCLGDNLLSRLGLALMAEIIIDQDIAVYDDRQGILEIFQILFRRLRTGIYRLFLSGDFFGIDRFDELGIILFLIQYGQ